MDRLDELIAQLTPEQRQQVLDEIERLLSEPLVEEPVPARPRRPVIRCFNWRTGWHVYECVEMPDGQVRAVYREWDGPDFLGYFTEGPDIPKRRTTYEDYQEYQRRLKGGQ
ncbi:MAG: hypothetical protein RMJ05_11865 [Thermomicrobium sp.]|nr:hypothetical protein [Thermomicrobium sp.]MDW8007393.1 hypothetical protein [Thermomicrobium sp.]